MRLVMIPLLDHDAPEQIPLIVDRFNSILPWIALVILVSTGLLNYVFWLSDTGYTPKPAHGYVKALVVKVLLANVLLLVAILFGLAPAMQDNAADWLWLLIGLGVVIMLISAGLRRSPTQLRRAAPVNSGRHGRPNE